MGIKDRIKLWVKIKFLPWAKKNRIILTVIVLCLVFITFTLIRKGRSPTDDTIAVSTEAVNDGISGADVKKELLTWNKKNPYSFVVSEVKAFSKGFYKNDDYKVIYTTKGGEYTYLKGYNGEPLWGINYGTVLADSAISRDFNPDFCAINGYQKKTQKETVIIGDTEKKKTLVTRKKNNPYTAKAGIEIPDNEYFKKYLLNDIDGNEIGCIYIAADLDIDD